MDAWSESSTQAAYDEVAETYAGHFTGTGPELPLELAMIDHFVTLLDAPKRVLDAGCGAGRMFPYLEEHGCEVRGVDLSAVMVALAVKAHPEVPVEVGTLRALPLPTESVEGVFSWYSIIHSSALDLPAIFAEMHRVLRPDGAVLVAFQTGSGVKDVAAGYRSRGHDVVLMRYGRTLEEITELLGAAGFMTVCSMQRDATGVERDGQAVVVATKVG